MALALDPLFIGFDGGRGDSLNLPRLERIDENTEDGRLDEMAPGNWTKTPGEGECTDEVGNGGEGDCEESLA